MGDCPEYERGKDEADDVASGRSDEPSDAAREAGEDRESHHAEREIDEDGEGAVLSAEQSDRAEDAEGLEGERDGTDGDGDPRAGGDQDRHQRGINELSGGNAFGVHEVESPPGKITGI